MKGWTLLLAVALLGACTSGQTAESPSDNATFETSVARAVEQTQTAGEGDTVITTPVVSTAPPPRTPAPSPTPTAIPYTPVLADYVRGLGNLYSRSLLARFDDVAMLFLFDARLGNESPSATDFIAYAGRVAPTYGTVAQEQIRKLKSLADSPSPPVWLSFLISPTTTEESVISCRLALAAARARLGGFAASQLLPDVGQCPRFYADYIASQSTDPAGYLGWIGKRMGVFEN